MYGVWNFIIGIYLTMASYLNAYFQVAITLIEGYNGKLPLHYYLKSYFAQNKKHGSKDRKNITQLCFNYYRLGHALKDKPIAERLKIAFFLCNPYQPGFDNFFEPHWILQWKDDLGSRLAFIKEVYPSFTLQTVFPFWHALSEGVDAEMFSKSHFVQPDLFLRIRPQCALSVKQKLAGLPFSSISDTAIALSNNTKLEDKLPLNKEAVIQDYSSQRVADFLQLVPVEKQLKVWDCCAASGGKSILAYDTLKNIHLTVTDVRVSILHNLQKRFSAAGIKNYTAFQSDLARPVNIREKFDLIICDVPCSGSGTWARTPESLYFFEEKEINAFSHLQQKIAFEAMKHLKPDAYFLYITCSVFHKENEIVVDHLDKNFPVEIVKAGVIAGYGQKADTMFAALLKRV